VSKKAVAAAAQRDVLFSLHGRGVRNVLRFFDNQQGVQSATVPPIRTRQGRNKHLSRDRHLVNMLAEIISSDRITHHHQFVGQRGASGGLRRLRAPMA
jgi:hypothetical protein